MTAAMEDSINVLEAYPMKGGDGPDSYAKNSIEQKVVVDATKELLSKAIKEKLELDMFLPFNTFHIADLGCSVGPNTFFSVENILEAVKFEYQSKGPSSEIPKFQVFFSDKTLNDFNILFNYLPQNRNYYAAGVPGSFYGRLFPKASINFFHSSLALHWLSRVPKDVMDKNSRAWNKGRIHYSNNQDEVLKAYQSQYAEDMECFLRARALETVHGGLIVLNLLGLPNDIPQSHHLIGNLAIDILGSCLVEMARKGVISEEKVDSFNMPCYFASPQELEVIVERNGCFSIEILEALPQHVSKHGTPSAPTFRAITEGLITQQFGEEILDDLFSLYQQKLEEQISIAESKKSAVIFVVLKRKTN